MSSEIEIGGIAEGVVTGVTSFGAFVKLQNGVEGLVHISEIADEYVTDIGNYVTVGDKINVKVLGLNSKQKYDLSLKKAGPTQKKPDSGSAGGQDTTRSAPPPPRSPRPPRPPRPAGGGGQRTLGIKPVEHPVQFEDKMNCFLKKSEEKLIDLKRNIQNKQGVKKRKKKK